MILETTSEELQLLDWVLCLQGSPVDGQKLGDLAAWGELREGLWRNLLQASLGETRLSIDLSEHDALSLLALLPTTFRWATGNDVGLSLKLKVAAGLWGDEETSRHEWAEKLRKLQEGPDANPIAASTPIDTGED